MARPFLTKRKTSKNYYVVITNNVTGKRSYKSTRTDNKETAELFLKELETSLGYASRMAGDTERLKSVILEGAERLANVVIEQKTPLEDILVEYQRNERVRALKPSTLKGNRNILNAFLEYCKTRRVQYVEQINYDVSRAYMDKLRIDGRSDGTLTNHRHALHGIFKKVKRPLGLRENPFEDVETPFRPKRKTHRCFTAQELKKLLGALEGEWRMVVILSMYTGLRFGDCCQFKLDYIDWDNDLILIMPSKTERYNKKIIIPLHEALKHAIREYTNALSGYLMPSMSDRQRKQSGILGKEFGVILNALGFEKNNSEGILDFHSLRHTFNTILANRGVDTSTRMKLVGHSNVETNQIYNHAIEPLKKAIETIPAINWKG